MHLSKIVNGHWPHTENQEHANSASTQLIQETMQEAQRKVEQLILELPPNIQHELGTLIRQAMSQSQMPVDTFIETEGKKNPNLVQLTEHVTYEVWQGIDENLRINEKVRHLDANLPVSTIREKIAYIKEWIGDN